MDPMPNRVLTSSGGPRHLETIGPKKCPHVKHGQSPFYSGSFIFTAHSSGRPAALCIVMLSYSLSQSSFADSKWSHKCDGSPQIGLFRMPCSCIFFIMTQSTLILPRLGDSVTLFLSQFPPLASSSFAHLVISEGASVKIQFYRLETSTPQQRPAATKWLQ